MNIISRATAPTPKFFKGLRLLGIILTAISGVFFGRSTSAEVKEIATHIATAGAVIAAVSQVTVDDKDFQIQNEKTKSGSGK